MDCKKCKHFTELVDSYDNDSKYVCLATSIFQDDCGTGFIYLIIPETYNDIESDCIDFINKID